VRKGAPKKEKREKEESGKEGKRVRQKKKKSEKQNRLCRRSLRRSATSGREVVMIQERSVLFKNITAKGTKQRQTCHRLTPAIQ
jgi:hypothetical protein